MDAVLYSTYDGKILAANPAACTLFKYTETEICSLGRTGLIDFHNSPRLAPMIEERENTGKTQGEITFVRCDGTRFPGWFNSSLFIDESGERKSVTLIRDLTQLKDRQWSLSQSLRELDDLYNNAPCGYHSVNADGIIIKINHTELTWLGYKLNEILGHHVRDIYSDASQSAVVRKMHDLAYYEEVHDVELEFKRKDGTYLPVLLNATAVCDTSGNFIMSRATTVDLTHRKALELELKRQANTDFLTGLESRRNFTKLAQRELAVSKRLNSPLGCLIIDIDHFKKINDTHGHDVGDIVLKAVGECCRRTLRDIDIAGRWGGEEFAVLLVGNTDLQVRNTAERLRVALSELKVAVDQATTLSFTVSIGGSAAKSSDVAIETMMKRADLALYSAKAAGRNCVLLDSD